MSLLSLEEYYKLKNDPSKKESYYEQLKILSDNTNSREYFKDDVQRKELHEKIIQEKLDQYSSMDKPVIHFILGSIGSGKTSMKDKFFDSSDEFLYVNFDEIKKQFPEYALLKKINPKKASEFVQPESAAVGGKLLKKAIKKKCHAIFEKNIVRNRKNELQLIEDIKKAIKKDYNVLLNIVFLDSFDEAWKRVQKRAKKIKRYVPKEKVENTFKTLFVNLNEVYKNISRELFGIKFWYNGKGVESPTPFALLVNSRTDATNDVSTNSGGFILIVQKNLNWGITIPENMSVEILKNRMGGLDELDFFPKWDYIESIEEIKTDGTKNKK